MISKIVNFNELLSRYLRREQKRCPLIFHHLKETCRLIWTMSNQFFAIFHVNVEKGGNFLLLLEECTQQFQPLRKELTHVTFQELKEKMVVPIAQVLCIAMENSKGNRQV